MWSGERTHKTWPSASKMNRHNPKPITRWTAEGLLFKPWCHYLSSLTWRDWLPASGVLMNLLSFSAAKLWAWTCSCLKEWRRNLWVCFRGSSLIADRGDFVISAFNGDRIYKCCPFSTKKYRGGGKLQEEIRKREKHTSIIFLLSETHFLTQLININKTQVSLQPPATSPVDP